MTQTLIVFHQFMILLLQLHFLFSKQLDFSLETFNLLIIFAKV